MATISVVAKGTLAWRPLSRRMSVLLLALLAAGVFVGVFAFLNQRPAIALDQARGMYVAEGGTMRFRWTSSRAEFGLTPHSGLTRVTIVLSIADWPRQPQLPVRIESDTSTLATVTIPAQPRRVLALLPPGATALRLHTPVARPPGGDWRWLGVQVLGVDAQPTGLPLNTLLQALLLAGLSVLLALGMAWAIPRGYGTVVALTLLGLALRLLWIADSPPLLHRDEAVSLVDAWHLARTGRDHLGHLLPLAAFEAYGDWISPLLTYLLLPWVALFGPQPLVARLVVAVFGALAVPCVYGLVRELRLPSAAPWAALIAALSPWQIFLSRVAIPPALVATCWTLCLWAAIRFVRDGRRRDAIWLALAAGVGLYAYPPMKLAAPLLLTLALALALWRHGWGACRHWWPAALGLSLLWAPFAASTLLNPSSGARLRLIMIKATSASEWLATWWSNYSLYFQPNLYYLSGGVRKIVQGMPDRGVALSAEAPLLLGLLGLPLLALSRERADRAAGLSGGRQNAAPVLLPIVLLLAGALVIAPLPASLTVGHPHTFRASMIAPLYAVLVGVGAALEWHWLGRLPARSGAIARMAGALVVVAALAWQSAGWFNSLIERYPSQAIGTWFFADGEVETMQRVVDYAPGFDEVWLDIGTVGRPYIFLLLAQPMSPAEAQARLVVERNPPQINNVTSIGQYHFVDFAPQSVPLDLPVLEALPTSGGGPGYLLQEWRPDKRRILLVRSMTTHVPDDSGDEDENN
ncbi:MAG TPA: glycosyltransferase family 39 protein [Roseiflexaceae bacterium]|nr:glycosyltransferase family 39 protein [Roseiflexaceae bacterium]